MIGPHRQRQSADRVPVATVIGLVVILILVSAVAARIVVGLAIGQ